MRVSRFLGLATAAAIAVSAPAALAVSAQAAVQHPVTSVTKIVNRTDGGGGGTWAYDSFTRTLNLTYLGKVTPAELAANPALASTPYKYDAQVSDQGTFRDIPGALTPDQGSNDAGKVLRPVQVSGPMNGVGQWNVFYASARAHNGLAPRVLRGPALNELYPSSTWPELAFPAGTTFSGVSESFYDYSYQAVPFTRWVIERDTHGHIVLNPKTHQPVLVKKSGFRQHWEDSSFNGDGQNPHGDGNITGLNH
jgi:hypothetical protein